MKLYGVGDLGIEPLDLKKQEKISLVFKIIEKIKDGFRKEVFGEE